MPKPFIVPGHDTTERVTMAEPTLETPAADQAASADFVDRVSRSNVSLFLVWFVLILVLKWPTLTQPPVWDASMSVFPAAITLAENNFDLVHLLAQPGYKDGGPNVHGTSLVTWLTAGVIALVGDDPALFPVLHLIHFAIAAAAMAGIYRFGVPLIGSRLAFAATFTVLIFPLVLTQAGYMYLEFPLLATTTFALLAWFRRDIPGATMWASLAVLIKGSGIVVAATLAAMAVLNPGREKRDLRSAAIMLLFPIAIVAASVLLIPDIEGPPIRDHWRLMISTLGLVPDLLVLLLSYLALTAISPPWSRRGNPELPAAPHTKATDRSIAIAALVLVFLGFYVSLPLFGVPLAVPPRYFVMVAPFVFIGLTAMARHRLPQVVVLSALLMIAGWFTLNRNGEFYARNTVNNFALIERSGAYVDLLDLQQLGIRTIADLPPDITVFYDQPAHYKLGYPLMGYADSGLANGYSIRHKAPFNKGILDDFPPEFYMLYEYPWLGGEIIDSIWIQAQQDPSRTVIVERLCSSAFCSLLIHVLPAGAS